MNRTIPLVCPVDQGECVDGECKKGKCKRQIAEEAQRKLEEIERQKYEAWVRELLGDD